MKTAFDNSVIRTTSRLAATLAMIVALALPSVYFGLSYLHQQATLQTEAQFTATRITQLIVNTNPELWQFQVVRLRTFLKGASEEEPHAGHRILDARGGVVVEDMHRVEPPTLVSAANLVDSGHVAGRFEIVYSLRPILWRTAGMGLLGLLLGGMTWWTLRVFPLRALRQALETLFNEKERAEVTLHSIGDAVITTDADGRIDYLNPMAEILTGWSSAQAIDRSTTEVFQVVHEKTRSTPEDPVVSALRDGKIIALESNLVLTRREGSTLPIECSTAPIRDRRGVIIGAVLVFRDVSASREMENKLSYQASHDVLTGLINRREFEVRLASALTQAREEALSHALCYMDLDQFKVVNDTCGHMAGDELLRQLGALLRSKIRNTDTLARLGGDEFGLLLVGCPLAQAERVAQTLLQAIAAFRFIWHGQTFAIGVSIGLVVIEAESNDTAQVLSAADAACYVAKGKGGSRVYVYQPDDTDLTERHGEMQWVTRLQRALEENRFRLYYQPIQSLTEDRGRHYEILMRLTDETGQIVPPGAFIPAAERYNLMPAIDRWVIGASFSALATLNRGRASDVRHVFSINLSGMSWGDDKLIAFITAEARRHGVSPDTVCFEITETAAISNLPQAVVFIKELKALGFRFSLDDFGSGVSSFGYLKQLPVDYLKIDGGFVKNMMADKIDHAMVEAINDIGHTMGIKTVAEFVESEAILERIRAIGIDGAQGYAIARPAPLETLMSGMVEQGNKP